MIDTHAAFLARLALAYWMAGVAVAHGLRFFVFDDPTNRQIVAAGGVGIYLFAALLLLLDHAKWAHIIVVLFPLVGVSLVLLTGSEVDDWQLAVGVTQFAAVAYVLHYWADRHWRAREAAE